MSIHIRIATADHKPTFFHLWKAFMQINEKIGSDILATEKSLAVYKALFDAYVSGSVIGVAILAYDDKQACGALLNGQGAPCLPFDFRDVQRSTGWGTYVDRSHYRKGIGKMMCDRAAEVLKRKGIDEVYDYTLVSNPAGVGILKAIGSEPREYIYVLPLGDGRDE
jgi:ribosomal protein S18 acetylase RimI-like enzyme